MSYVGKTAYYIALVRILHRRHLAVNSTPQNSAAATQKEKAPEAVNPPKPFYFANSLKAYF